MSRTAAALSGKFTSRGREKNTILIDLGRLNLKLDNLKNYLYSFTFSYELSAKHYVCLPPSPRDI